MNTAVEGQSIYEQLMEKIFSGDVSPGSRLIERELAKQLGVSRIPVREALTRMVAQGALVGGDKRRSVRVRQYSAAEIHQLFEFRELIEGGAARSAATQATPRQIAQLLGVCDQMAELIGLRRFCPAWANLEHRFHESVARAGGNEWVITTLYILLKQSHYVFYRLRWRAMLECSDEEHWSIKRQTVMDHRAIVESLASGDADASEQLMRQHIRRSHENDRWPEMVDPTPSVRGNRKPRRTRRTLLQETDHV